MLSPEVLPNPVTCKIPSPPDVFPLTESIVLLAPNVPLIAVLPTLIFPSFNMVNALTKVIACPAVLVAPLSTPK